MKVLVVEDDALLALELCATLEYVGHEADWTVDADGLKKLWATFGEPEALICDGHLAHGQTAHDVYDWCQRNGFDTTRFLLHTGDRAFAERFGVMHPEVIICHKTLDKPERFLPQPVDSIQIRERA